MRLMSQPQPPNPNWQNSTTYTSDPAEVPFRPSTTRGRLPQAQVKPVPRPGRRAEIDPILPSLQEASTRRSPRDHSHSPKFPSEVPHVNTFGRAKHARANPSRRPADEREQPSSRVGEILEDDTDPRREVLELFKACKTFQAPAPATNNGEANRAPKRQKPSVTVPADSSRSGRR